MHLRGVRIHVSEATLKRGDTLGAMDLTNRIGVIRQNAASVRDLLQNERFVVCLGQRSSLCFFLAGHLSEQQVVGACTTAEEALVCIAERQPSFLLCSDQLESGCGIALVISVKARWPQMRTLLLLTGRPEAARLRSVIAAGCDGLLLETSLGLGNATQALRSVSGGGIVIDRGVMELLQSRPGACNSPQLPALSPREREVLSLLARGDNNADIAAALVISLETVKTHVKNLLLKLGARGRTHAAVLAIERELVDWPRAAGAR